MSRRQLVVLGPPGAGKSTLAALFTLAVIEQDTDRGPVPVLLSVAGWDPAERIEDWCVRRITEDYLDFGANGTFNTDQVSALLLDRRIVPVLDGLDEMPRSVLSTALADLDRAAEIGLRMVLTCRSAEFAQAVHDRGALAHAAVVDIEPIRVEDTAAYLTEPEVANSHRWSVVIDRIRREPRGPLAHALSTPLMINLARSIYRPSSSPPEELTSFTTTPEITSHLLKKYLPTVFTAGEHDKAQYWLSFLSNHLHEQGGPDFEWWHLTRAVPRWLILLLITLVSTLCGSLLLGITAASHSSTDSYITPTSVFWESMAYATGAGAALGAAVGFLGGLRTVRSLKESEQPRAHRGRFSTLSDTLAGVQFLIAALCTLGILVVLGARMTDHSFLGDAAVTIATTIFHMRTFNSEAWLSAIPVALLACQAILVINLLGFRAGTPKSSTPNLRRLLPSLTAGLLLGLSFSALWVTLEIMSYGLDELNITPYAFAAAMIGIPMGIVRWLAAPVEERKASSPASVLRSDRTALLTAALSSGALTALGFLAFTIDEDRRNADLTIDDRRNADLTIEDWGITDLTLADWVTSGVVGLAIMAVVLVGSGSAWFSYTVARLWLACRGRLPWRLMRFLRTAHEKGVLRQVGPAYQLRHELLRTHLAEQWPSKRRPPPARGVIPRWLDIRRRSGSQGRRWLHGAVTLATVVLLMGTTSVLHFDGYMVLPIGAFVHAVAFSHDGTTLATGNDDGTLQLWDTTTDRPTPTRTFHHDDWVNAVAFNHDGTTLATGSDDGTARLWDTTTDRPTPTRTFHHDDWVNAVAFNHDGTTLATGSDGGTARLWDTTTNRPTPTQTLDHDGQVRAVAFNHDGTTLATATGTGTESGDGNYGGTARLWDTTTNRPTPTQTLDHDGQVNAVAFNHDGTTLATGSDDGAARLWGID
ncbi:hypothetical protein GCM10009602_53760 [Nocardiopsis tropica]